MTKLSPHFSLSEFNCKDGTPVPASAVPALRELCVNVLEPMRTKYGPCTVLSGYRTVTHNRAVGGARYSQHIYTDTPGSVAADVRFAKGTPKKWYDGARWRFRTKRLWRGRGGVGLYVGQNFIHVDSGPRRTWSG